MPTYHKPEAPGIWMNFDNTVSIHIAMPSRRIRAGTTVSRRVSSHRSIRAARSRIGKTTGISGWASAVGGVAVKPMMIRTRANASLCMGGFIKRLKGLNAEDAKKAQWSQSRTVLCDRCAFSATSTVKKKNTENQADVPVKISPLQDAG